MPYGNVSNLETLLLALPENGSLVALINGYLVKLERENSTTFILDLMSACGKNAISEYSADFSNDTAIIRGDYTCADEDPLELLDTVGNYLRSALQDLEVDDRDVVENIDWHNIVLYIDM